MDNIYSIAWGFNGRSLTNTKCEPYAQALQSQCRARARADQQWCGLAVNVSNIVRCENRLLSDPKQIAPFRQNGNNGRRSEVRNKRVLICSVLPRFDDMPRWQNAVGSVLLLLYLHALTPVHVIPPTFVQIPRRETLSIMLQLGIRGLFRHVPESHTL